MLSALISLSWLTRHTNQIPSSTILQRERERERERGREEAEEGAGDECINESVCE